MKIKFRPDMTLKDFWIAYDEDAAVDSARGYGKNKAAALGDLMDKLYAHEELRRQNFYAQNGENNDQKRID